MVGGKARVKADRGDTPGYEPWALRYGAWIVAIGGGLTVLVGLAAVFWLPTVDRLVGDFQGGDLQSARADLRSSGLRLAAGIGAATAGLLAWGRLDLSRQQHRLEEQSKRDERFARAVELLGSDKPSVRLGALYALEALAIDGHSRQTIFDVIAAFARSSSRSTSLPAVLEAVEGTASVPEVPGQILDELDTGSEFNADDFEVAVKICLRCPPGWRLRLDLRQIELVDRTIGHLHGADFSGARLVECRFEGGTLTKVSFVGAQLETCRFTDSLLDDALFEQAKLTKCAFRRVTVTGTLLAAASYDDCTFYDIVVDGTSSSPTTEQSATGVAAG